MNRIAALLVSLVVYSLLAVGASAKDVASHEVAKTPQDVADYWTPERMRNAKPVPLAKGGGGTKEGTATEVPPPYTVFPTSTNGKVFFTDDGVNYVCSGTSIDTATVNGPGNQNLVWTAGHCVNEGPGDFYTNWAFVPAYRDGGRPYGTFAATSLHTTDPWRTTGDFSYDLGAAVVASNPGTLQSTVGGRALAFNYDRSQRYNAYGYPAARPFNGQRLWMCDAPLYTTDSNTSPQTMGIRCNMTGGSSGGGWVVPLDGRVYSVNSYGYRSLKDVMFGPYQGDVAQTLFATAAAS